LSHVLASSSGGAATVDDDMGSSTWKDESRSKQVNGTVLDRVKKEEEKKVKVVLFGRGSLDRRSRDEEKIETPPPPQKEDFLEFNPQIIRKA